MRLGLTGKYTLGMGGVVLAAMGLFAYLNLHTLQTHLLEEAVRDVDFLSETIIQTTHYQMLEDDRKRVYQMIEEVGNQEGIEHIRIINKDGSINFSTEAAEIGAIINKKAEACNVCHAANIPLVNVSSMNRSRFFTDRNGRDVLGIARGIYNEPVCSNAACHYHDPGTKLLGVLDVIVSLDRAKNNLSEYRNSVGVLTLSLLLVTAFALTLLTRTLIDTPVQRLLRHTERVARGDFSSHIELSREDEIGHLATSFNHMTANLQTAQSDLKDLMRNLEAMVEERSRKIQEIQAHLVQSEKLASIGELAAGIAHEINNPLAGIVIFSSMVLNHKDLSPALHRDVQVVLDEAQRCADIVRRLLEFSREAPPHKAPESVNHLLDSTLHLLENQMTFQNIVISRRYAPDLPQICVDGNQINQVFMNILLNAAQAMAGGGTLSLESRLAEGGKQIAILLGDNGCGIPDSGLKRIFDPFFTTKEEGTGLGLSVSYGIVENHGGKIDVESREGEGTTFTVLLPLDAPEVAAGERSEVENACDCLDLPGEASMA